MKKLIKLLCLSFILVMLFASCGETETPADSTEETSAETETEAVETKKVFRLTENGKSCVTVIRSDDADDETIDRAKDVRAKVQSAVEGTTVTIGNDFVIPGKSHNADAWEVLVGKTNYDESTEVLDSLGYLDFAIKIVGHKLVITSPDSDRMDTAMTQFAIFMKESVYQDENGDWWVSFEDYVYNYNYKAKDLKINGHPISDYVIVYPKKSVLSDAAEEVKAVIGKATGYGLDIVTDDNAEQECEILVGSTKRLSVDVSYSKYSVYLSGSKLVFSVAGAASAEAAADALYSEKLKAGGDINIDSTLSLSDRWCTGTEQARAEGTDLRIMSYNILTEHYDSTAITAPRAEILGCILETYKPDAAGLQECCDYWIKYFAYYCGSYKMLCTKQDNGNANYSVIIYNSDKYDVVESGVHSYSKRYSATNCRNVGWAVLKDKTTGFTFALTSTHWDWDKLAQGIDCSSHRKVQADEMAEIVDSLAKKYNCPVFSTGDFNSNQASESITYYREISPMWCAYYDSKNWKNRDGNFIDHVFATKADTEILFTMKVTDCNASDASDHRPVISDIKITK